MEESYIREKIQDAATRHYGFNLLMEEYKERVYWLVRKMVIDHDDSDDLVQEIFVKVWNNLDKFRADSQLFTWIYRIATNECLNFLKKKKRRFFIPIGDVEGELRDKLEGGQYMSGDDIQIRLHNALLKLPDKQRLVFNLKYHEDMKYEEMAEVTDTSVGALKASYHHAVKKIEELLNRD